MGKHITWDEYFEAMGYGRNWHSNLYYVPPVVPFVNVAGVWDDTEYRLTGKRSGKTAMVLRYLERLDSVHYTPKQINFCGTTTVCIFDDDKIVVSRPQKGENFDKETGVAMCIAKYIYGSRSKFLRAVENGHQQ